MSQPQTPDSTPNDTGAADGQTGTDTASIYDHRDADRAPTRDEIEPWRRHHYDDMIAKAAARGEPTEHGTLAEHQAATATGAAYMNLSALRDRLDAEPSISDDDGAIMATRAILHGFMGKDFDAATEPLPSAPRVAPVTFAEAAPEASAPEVAAPSAVDQDGDAVEVDIVELGVRYEKIRQARTDANRQGKVYGEELAAAEREFLSAIVDSGLASVSLVMPESGENRVLAPSSKVWPKIREDESQPVDENGKRPQFDEAARIEALRAAGHGDIIEEKINNRALGELFDTYVTEADMPDEIRAVYELSRSWSVSSTRGRTGRVRTPTAGEVAQGRRPRAS